MEGDRDRAGGAESPGAFQSTPSAWRETEWEKYISDWWEISIHSLRMEGDRFQGCCHQRWHISIHSLRMEGDARLKNWKVRYNIFQSTPSAWRETFAFFTVTVPSLFQSTPSAWRETHVRLLQDLRQPFQSTPSAWRETYALRGIFVWMHISIHSLRMEGDGMGEIYF